MSETTYDWKMIIDRLNKCLRLKTTPIGLKRFATAAEMEAIPKIRKPEGKKYVVCQLAGQASRLNFTVGFTKDDIYGTQCLTVLGMLPRGGEFLSGNQFNGVWYGTLKDSAEHQKNMYCVPYDGFEAAAFSPLVSGRLDPPDICMLYMTPGQMIYFINGLQWLEYEPVQSSVVGESSCSDTWGKALLTGKPSFSLNCYAERRYGGVPDEELLICVKPDQLVKAIGGMEALSKNGLRYPYAPYGLQNDCQEGMGVSYK